jgi:sugar/nucleoside kinase (ribokinase family)
MDAVCLGILVADLFASPVNELPGPGQLTLTERFVLGSGGCASNTAKCLRRLGRTVNVLGKVGEDILGDFVLRDLEVHGIETGNISRSARRQTSSTVILNVRGQDRRYLHAVGANADFTLADVPVEALDGARVLYVGGFLAMPGFGATDLGKLFQAAHERGILTVLDVVIPAGAACSVDTIKPALQHADYFFPNEDEAWAITGITDPGGQAGAFCRLNPRMTVVITRGKQGSLAKSGSVVMDTPAFPVESIDESGAGDAFTAGFITALLEGWPLDLTLRFAHVVGASCTRALGCIDGVFTFDEAVEVLESGRHRLSQRAM